MNDKKEQLKNVRRKINERLSKDKNRVVVGYQKTPIVRKEGETWWEEGKQWEMKGGIKRSLSKLQDAKTPWWCPVCEKPLRGRLDSKFFRIRGKCHTCVSKDETNMRIEGTWKDYSNKIIMENQMSYLKDKLIELTYYLAELKENPDLKFPKANEELGTIVMVENWKIPAAKLVNDLAKELVQINKTLNKIEQEYTEQFGGLPEIGQDISGALESLSEEEDIEDEESDEVDSE